MILSKLIQRVGDAGWPDRILLTPKQFADLLCALPVETICRTDIVLGGTTFAVKGRLPGTTVDWTETDLETDA